MTTYAVVMAIVVGAGVLVLLAIWWRTGPTGDRRERRWVALGGSFTAAPGRPSWVSGVTLAGRPVEAIDLTAPGATLADVLSGQLGPALAARPTVVVVWVGPDDLLHGRPLPRFLADLGHLIDRCREDGVAVVLLGLPPVAWPADLRGRRPERVMAAAHAEWRRGLIEIARYGGADLVDPARVGGDEAVLVREGRWTLLADGVRGDLGPRLADVIRRSMRSGATPGALKDGQDGPADPVVRRRLGLPPLR